MSVHCPFCQKEVTPNPNEVFCPECGNPIPELKEQQESEAPAAGAPGEANVTGESPQDPSSPQHPAEGGASNGKNKSGGLVDDDKSQPAESDGLTCPSCGEPVEEEWDACPYCTADLSQQGSEDSVPDKCPQCGYEPINPEMNICPKCQTSLPGEVASHDGESEPAHPADPGGAPGSDTITLDFEDGDTIEVQDGTTLGTELRQHLHDHGVATNEAMRISRQHLLFKHSPDGFRVVDLESTNGTELNGKELEPNREYDISDGDQLVLGGSAEITVHTH